MGLLRMYREETMKQTFVINIEYDDIYRTICDWAKEPQCVICNKYFISKDQKANVGDNVFFKCLHYWYKGIAAKGTVEHVEDNCIEVKFVVVINPKERPLLCLADLENVLPNKNWKDRYSDILLDYDEAQILNDKWEMLLQSNNSIE